MMRLIPGNAARPIGWVALWLVVCLLASFLGASLRNSSGGLALIRVEPSRLTVAEEPRVIEPPPGVRVEMSRGDPGVWRLRIVLDPAILSSAAEPPRVSIQVGRETWHAPIRVTEL
jgi:hypothetical protein